MLKNKLCKKYFPVSNHTVMEKDDLDRLIQYVKRIDKEVEIENIQRTRGACEMGLREVRLLKPVWNESDLEKLLGNLSISFSNLTGKELYILNTVLYWNKYSFPINTWIHPVYHNGCKV